MLIDGINLGCGKGWQQDKWIGLDLHNGYKLNKDTIFPYDNNSIKYVFSSHFFEHIDDDTAFNLLQQSYRVLKESGVIRIIVPNFQLLLDKYKENDLIFYKKYTNYRMRDSWRTFNISLNLENMLVHWFCNYFDNDNNCLIPIINQELIRESALKMTVEEFSNWCMKHLPTENIQYGHMNWWTFDKFVLFLQKAQFCVIKERKHNVSFEEDLLNSNFDSRKAQNLLNLYVEALK